MRFAYSLGAKIMYVLIRHQTKGIMAKGIIMEDVVTCNVAIRFDKIAAVIYEAFTFYQKLGGTTNLYPK